MSFKVEFNNGQVVDVPADTYLSEVLDASNSPVLFGCRNGICATCIVKVTEGMTNLPPKLADEEEVLELITKDHNCRLACQLKLKGNVKMEYLGK